MNKYLAFIFRNRSGNSLKSKAQIIQSTLLPIVEYGDTIYQNASVTTLKPLDSVYHSANGFITGDSFNTHHYILYLVLIKVQ